MSRFEDLENAGLRIAYDDAGNPTDIIDSRGKSIGLALLKSNRVTGGLKYQLPGGGSVGVLAGAVAPRTVVLLGDSLAQNAKTETATSLYTTGRDWLGYANATNSGQLTVVKNAGVSGERTNQMLTRFDADVTPHAPAIVVLDTLTNDLGQAYTYEQIWPSIIGLYEKCQKIGAVLLFVGEAGKNYSVAAAIELGKVYAAARALEQITSGFIFEPVATSIRMYGTSNSNVSNGGLSAANAADGTHWTPVAAQIVGGHLAPTLSNLVRARDGRSGHAHWYNKYDTPKQYGNTANAILNGVMMDKLHGVIGTGGSGSMPDYWTFARSGAMTATLSAEPRALPAPGWWMQAVVTGATALADYATLQQYSIENSGAFANVDAQIFDAFPAGDTLVLSADIDATATSGVINEMSCTVEILNTSGVVQYTAGFMLPYSGDQAGLTSVVGRFKTLPFVIPAGKVAGWRLRTTFKVRTGTSTSVAGGEATVKIGAVECYVQ